MSSFFKLIHAPWEVKIHPAWRLAGISLFAGILGNFFTKYHIEQEVPEKFLVKYENEQQIVKLLEQTNKPVIIHYYLGSDNSLWFMRRMMLRYSNICQGKATFVMANLAQSYIHARNFQLARFQNPISPMLEIRKPNPYGKEQTTHIVRTFDYPVNEQCIRAFLEEEGLMPVRDGLQPFVNASYKSVFR